MIVPHRTRHYIVEFNLCGSWVLARRCTCFPLEGGTLRLLRLGLATPGTDVFSMQLPNDPPPPPHLLQMQQAWLRPTGRWDCALTDLLKVPPPRVVELSLGLFVCFEVEMWTWTMSTKWVVFMCLNNNPARYTPGINMSTQVSSMCVCVCVCQHELAKERWRDESWEKTFES